MGVRIKTLKDYIIDDAIITSQFHPKKGQYGSGTDKNQHRKEASVHPNMVMEHSKEVET